MTCADANKPRRQFLTAASLGALGVAVAPGLHLIALAAADEKTVRQASPTVRWGMLVDINKCQPGCNQCVSACNSENRITEHAANPRQGSQWIRKIDLVPQNGQGPARSLPMMCQHCQEPPCVDVCPTGASFKRADGIVLVDRHLCIGCRYCMMACPYKARSLVHQPLSGQNPAVPRGMGCVEACTFCVHRVDRGQSPACVEACPQGALLFGDLHDPDSAIRRRLQRAASVAVRADLKLDPGVRYEGL